MDALIVGHGSGLGSPASHQYVAMRMHRGAIRRELGVICHFRDVEPIEQVEQVVRDHRQADIAILMIHWRESREKVIDTFARLSAMNPRPYLVFLDYYAQTSSPFFGVLPFVDRYVKRQVLRDRGRYHEPLQGGFIFTDFLVRQLGYDIDGWSFGSEPDRAHEHKITHGWNLAVTPWYHRWLQFNRLLPRHYRRRRFDVNARIGAPVHEGKVEWYHRYREHAVEQISRLAPTYRLTDRGRLRLRHYARELRDSRIVISPFGWGELCFRDYEAVCSGCLLIKGDMSHLVTSPDIFLPHETYVPVRWDLADLEATCRHYLEHPEEARQIVANAQQRLADYFSRNGFIEDFRRSVLTPPTFAPPEPVGTLQTLPARRTQPHV